jgi:two-component system response regulator PhoP
MDHLFPTIAVIEDDEDLRANLLLYLRSKHYTAWGAASAEAFYRELAVCAVDILLIDLGLPGEDGLSALRHLRQNSQMGIIVITARGGTESRIEGLNAGADHYFIKPVDMRELVAAIETVWRRINQLQTNLPHTPLPAIAQSVWVLDPNDWTLKSPSGKKSTLTDREFALVATLLHAQGEVIGKVRLHAGVFPDADQIDSHRIDVILSRLRQKIQLELHEVLPIRTIFGKGFVFITPEQMRNSDAY